MVVQLWPKKTVISQQITPFMKKQPQNTHIKPFTSHKCLQLVKINEDYLGLLFHKWDYIMNLIYSYIYIFPSNIDLNGVIMNHVAMW